jgi:hypothetical protein
MEVTGDEWKVADDGFETALDEILHSLDLHGGQSDTPGGIFLPRR